MFEVFFENGYGMRSFIGKAETRKNIFPIIEQDLTTRAPHFKWYYTRSWTTNSGEIHYDVGSWSEFYIAVPIS